MARLEAAAGGAGGSWYVILQGLARLVNRVRPDIEITVVEGGGVMNHERVGTGELPMAILNPPMTFAATHGNPPYSRAYPDLRVGVTNIATNHLQFVVRQDVPMSRMEDWREGRVALRLPVDRVGTVDRLVFDMALAAVGLTPADVEALGGALVPAENYDRQLALYTSGEVDGFWQFMAIPAPSIEAGNAVRRVKGVSLPDTLVARLAAAGWDDAEMTRGAYGTFAEPVRTVSMGTSLGFHAGLDEEIVYAIVSAICENEDAVRQTHPAAQGFTAERAWQNPAGPLHEGAARYFRERGFLA